MKYLKFIAIGLSPIVLTILGVLAIVFGEIDDAPGLMLIGCLIIGIASFINIKLTTSKTP